ncbi:hypothetical protein RDABS01_013476, partial [Bienertia sinuspersici]
MHYNKPKFVDDPMQGVKVSLGTYNTIEEASKAYEQNIIEFQTLSVVSHNSPPSLLKIDSLAYELKHCIKKDFSIINEVNQQSIVELLNKQVMSLIKEEFQQSYNGNDFDLQFELDSSLHFDDGFNGLFQGFDASNDFEFCCDGDNMPL